MPKRALMVGVGLMLTMVGLVHASPTSQHAVAVAAEPTTTSTTTTLQPTTPTTSTTTTVVVPTTAAKVEAPTPTAPAPEPAPQVEVAPEPEPEPQPQPHQTSGSVEDAIATYFGDVYDKAVRVARCESGLNPSIVSPGGGNYGLFQINSVHRSAFAQVTGVSFDQGWSDPYLNAQYARSLYDSAGWGPWSCGGA